MGSIDLTGHQERSLVISRIGTSLQYARIHLRTRGRRVCGLPLSDWEFTNTTEQAIGLQNTETTRTIRTASAVTRHSAHLSTLKVPCGLEQRRVSTRSTNLAGSLLTSIMARREMFTLSIKIPTSRPGCCGLVPTMVCMSMTRQAIHFPTTGIISEIQTDLRTPGIPFPSTGMVSGIQTDLRTMMYGRCIMTGGGDSGSACLRRASMGDWGGSPGLIVQPGYLQVTRVVFTGMHGEMWVSHGQSVRRGRGRCGWFFPIGGISGSMMKCGMSGLRFISTRITTFHSAHCAKTDLGLCGLARWPMACASSTGHENSFLFTPEFPVIRQA